MKSRVKKRSPKKKSGAGHISELYAEFTPKEREEIEKGAKKTEGTITRGSGNVFADLELPDPEESSNAPRCPNLPKAALMIFREGSCFTS
jgi:hypothetical protein